MTPAKAAKKGPSTGVLVVCILGLFGFMMCIRALQGDESGSTDVPQAVREDVSKTWEAPAQPKAQESHVAAAGVTYDVFRETKVPGFKRSLDVRLSGRTDEAELRRIALELKGRDPAHYKRTFIGYLLPGMKPGAGGWATTHFNPELEVEILGMTRERLDVLAAKADSSRVLGTWVFRGIMAAIVTIERSPEGLVMLQWFKDGSEGVTLLQEQHEPQPGRQYHYKEGPPSPGEHLRINRAGDLEVWDQYGLVITAPKR